MDDIDKLIERALGAEAHSALGSGFQIAMRDLDLRAVAEAAYKKGCEDTRRDVTGEVLHSAEFARGFARGYQFALRYVRDALREVREEAWAKGRDEAMCTLDRIDELFEPGGRFGIEEE